MPSELIDKALAFLFAGCIVMPIDLKTRIKSLDLMMHELAPPNRAAGQADVTAHEMLEKIRFEGEECDENNQRLLDGFLEKSRQYPAPIETAALIWLTLLVPFVGAPEGHVSITGHLAPTARRSELLNRLVDRWQALPEEQLKVAKGNLKEVLHTLLKTQCNQLPDEAKTEVLNRLTEEPSQP